MFSFLLLFIAMTMCEVQSLEVRLTCAIPRLEHGVWQTDKQGDLQFFPETLLKYECFHGYMPTTINATIKCVFHDGTANWTKSDELCKVAQPISCSDPGYIDYADRFGHVFTFPNNVTYVCYDGYKLRGSETRFCSPNGRWLPSFPPVCEAIYCPILSDFPNGTVVSSDRRFNSIATYKCDKHFKLYGNSQRICQHDGTWTGDMPFCEEITCFDPGVTQKVRVLPKKHIYKEGDLVIFLCENNSDRVTSKCLNNNEWSAQPPICAGLKTEEGKVATIKPDDTTLLKVVSCDDPGHLNNGERIFTGFSFNSTVTYVCDEGYEMKGESTLFCLETGKWDLDILPICIKHVSKLKIVGSVFGILLCIAVLTGGYYCFRLRKTTLQGYGFKSKALTSDATTLEEVSGLGLDEGKKEVPVTVL